MALNIKNVSKIYTLGEIKIKALDKACLNINDGEIAVILGPSGSGKSTLLNIVGGIDLADEGKIMFDKNDISRLSDNGLTEYRRTKVGFIFQFYNLVPNLTVYENVEVSEYISENPLSIEEVLKSVGMLEYKDRFPRELSGGQQQRVSVARALVKRTKILLCDEPTGALDYEMSKDILKVLKDINIKYNTTILIVTHNNAIANIADRIIRLRSGKVVEDRLNDNIIPPERIEW